MENTMNQEHIEAATTGAKIMYGASGATVLFGLTASEIGAYCAIFSALVAVCGLFITTYFKWQDHKIKKAVAREAIDMSRATNKIFED